MRFSNLVSFRRLACLGLALLALACGNAAQAAPVQWSANGHYYELVSGSYTWSDAVAGAASRTYKGMTGYLATITSASEQNFISSLNSIFQVNSPTSIWVGGSDAAKEGTWKWVTGPEAGQIFYIAGAASQPGYSNWWIGEPNGSTFENALLYAGWTNQADWLGRWNDGYPLARTSYLVEYSAPAAVPEPNSLALLAAAGIGAVTLRRRRAAVPARPVSRA